MPHPDDRVRARRKGKYRVLLASVSDDHLTSDHTTHSRPRISSRASDAPARISRGGAWYVNDVSQKVVRCTIRGGASVCRESCACESESESRMYADSVLLLRMYRIEALCRLMDCCKAGFICNSRLSTSRPPRRYCYNFFHTPYCTEEISDRALCVRGRPPSIQRRQSLSCRPSFLR